MSRIPLRSCSLSDKHKPESATLKWLQEQFYSTHISPWPKGAQLSAKRNYYFSLWGKESGMNRQHLWAFTVLS